MRLWSIHPRYLDRQGLVALWREGLLAQNVLGGKTKGYRFHPQLERFKASPDPLAVIGAYLHWVALEASSRSYRFDCSKILVRGGAWRLTVTRGQLEAESRHLVGKLKRRDPKRLESEAYQAARLPAHPSFKVVVGGIEPWEKGAV